MTLKISDDEIRHSFEISRAQHLNKIFKPAVIFASGYLLKTVIDYFTNEDKTLYHIVSSAIVLIMIFVWALVRWRWPLHAPKVIFIFALIECIKLNLVIRD
jgi:hypothetical protein